MTTNRRYLPWLLATLLLVNACATEPSHPVYDEPRSGQAAPIEKQETQETESDFKNLAVSVGKVLLLIPLIALEACSYGCWNVLR